MNKEEFCNQHNEELLNYALNKVAEVLKHKVIYHRSIYSDAIHHAIFSVSDLANEDITLDMIDYSLSLSDVFDYLGDTDEYNLDDDTDYTKEELVKWAHKVIDDSLYTHGFGLYIYDDINNLSSNDINILIEIITVLKDLCVCPMITYLDDDNTCECNEMLIQLKNLTNK